VYMVLGLATGGMPVSSVGLTTGGMHVSSVAFGYRWDACERWSVGYRCDSWLQLGNLGAVSCLDVIKYRCYYLQLNLLLSLFCYKSTYHYFPTLAE
jgi:hypothetical protein